MSWFKHKPRSKQPEKLVPQRSSPLQEKYMDKVKKQQELPTKKSDKE
jgi:hypothetical protein